MTLKRILSIFLIFCFLGTSITLPSAKAQFVTTQSSGLSFQLPKPGTRVNLSPAFRPVLIRGLKVHPENPFIFDFIVVPGDEKLSADEFKKTSQRMVNYFLASLAIPEKDLWVNLSPLEKNHIIPDTLNKTELGRDLLAEDYMLKQVGASLIYPESNLGKTFWAKVYEEAYRKFGITQIPVSMFNKIWILPEKASVFERGNTVYIVNAHLKVMLEEDYLAQRMLGKRISPQEGIVPVKDISKQVLREIVIPAVEKEVNEDKNFSQLRQVFYALILAQWYQDVFKKSILNKIYSGQSKVSGIDVSDPKNRDLIYRQYLSAYKKGVFNYIKEETDRLTQQPVPRKYFSGGFVGRHVDLAMASDDEVAKESASLEGAVDVSVNVKPSMKLEPLSNWYDLNRPLSLLKELKDLYKDGKFDREGLYSFIEKYSVQVANQTLYPVQGAWPVLKAVALLETSEEKDLISALEDKYSNAHRPELVDKIFLMSNIFDREKWLNERAPNLVGRRIYLAAAEIHHWAGGLGPVMKFHGKGMKDLGADVAYIEPWYQLRRDKGNPAGDPLNYEDPDVGLKELNNNFDEFDVQIGDINGINVQTVHVKVARAIDENGIPVFMFRDVQPDGSSFYTKMLYNYNNKDYNPISQEQSMAFLNVAGAELIKRLETKRMREQGNNWKPAVVHTNDGQYAPLQAVMMSRFGREDAVKNIFWAFTTHTYGNRGGNGNAQWAEDIFLKHMMGVKSRFIDAFRLSGRIDYTSGGVRLANWAGGVSNKQRDDMQSKDPNVTLTAVTNGAVPEEMAVIFRQEFKKLQAKGIISEEAQAQKPTAREIALTKIESKKRLNETDRIKTVNGSFVHVDLDRPMIGYVRRLVGEKAGRLRAFSDDNIWRLVQLGYNVILLGNHQGEASVGLAAGLIDLERRITAQKNLRPNDFPGSFQFVQSFTPYQKKVFLAAADVTVQDSDNHTGAAEFSEEDITANGGLHAGPTYREGVIVDQGIPIDFDHPGNGQTLIPKEDTAESWFNTVYKPLMDLWDKDKEHINFYKNAELSPRLNRIQRYLITSAAYLREYNKVLERQEKESQADRDAQIKMVEALGNDQEIIDGILNNGRNGVKNPFGFIVWGKGVFEADSRGLISFIKKKNELEEAYGYDVFLYHYLLRKSTDPDGKEVIDGDFQRYLRELFNKTAASGLLNDWIINLENETGPSTQERAMRLGQFIVGLANELENKQKAKVADVGMVVPGGIKLDNIPLERHGGLMTDLVSDKAFEGMLLKDQGLYGVIVGITPIGNLLDFVR